MIDWLTIVIALAIIIVLIGFFGFLAWKINMSEPLLKDDNQLFDSINDKKKKEKSNNEQGKKKRKDQKKSKRENKDEEQQKKLKEPLIQTSEETDDEREESEQESSTPPPQTQTVETSSKTRKRNKNKTRSATPPPSSTHINPKDEKNQVTTRAPPVTHPKLGNKTELESTKQQAKVQVKSSQVSNKQTLPVPTPSTTKKTTNEIVQQQEQPFTTVGSNRNKAGTSSLQQQQNKTQVNTTTTSVAPVQQPALVQVQQEQLPPRQQVLQKETPTQLNGFATNPLPLKQQPSAKLADLIKILPSSQVVVTELMSALDAYPLSTDELDIIMHKIANKQSVIKQDWSKLQHGEKVDPQVHIGQVMDESVKAYQEDIKNNSMKHIKELTDEVNKEKRRINDLLKEKHDKEKEIEILHAQLDSVVYKQQTTQLQPQQQQQIQILQVQLQRITEENIHLNHQLAQQQQLTTSNLINNTDSTNVQVRVLSDQIKKLSVDNGNLEKKANTNELLAKEAQKEKDDLIRNNEQLVQSLENVQKELKQNEEKLHKESNEKQTLHMNQIDEYKDRIKQLESDNEQLRREEIVHVEPPKTTDIQTITLNNEEREQYEKEINELKQINNSNQQDFEEKQREYNDLKQELSKEIEQYKTKFDDIQTQRESKENELRQEIERLKQDKINEQRQVNESRDNELEAKNAQINALRVELDEIKAKNESTNSQFEERVHQEHEKQRNILINLLSEDVRHQLPHDNQDFEQWLSSYRHIFESNIETNKKRFQEESSVLKHENDELRKNINDIENQLKEIEKTVQNKEELLLAELKSKDVTVESTRNENDELNGEIQRLRNETERLQSIHDASVNEIRALKLQLDERFLVAANSPPVVADESFELVKQPSPSLSPIVIDIRAEQLNELIRSSKEALENQDTITQQLDEHLNDIHHGETGETSTSNVDEATVSTSSDHQQFQS